MIFERFKKNNDISEYKRVVDYLYDIIRGEDSVKPRVTDPKSKKLLTEIGSILENKEIKSSDNDLLIDLIKSESNLSEFGANMSYIASQMGKLSMDLTGYSTSNMAIVQETTAGMDEVSSAIASSTSILEDLSQKSESLSEMTQKNTVELVEMARIGYEVTEQTNQMSEKILALAEVPEDVEDIVSAVGNIAKQTNLLALNASIEAARAGDAGRGFAVVADEIRKLAEDTQNKLVEMKKFTSIIKIATSEVTDSVEDTKDSMGLMSDKIGQVNNSFEKSLDDLQLTMTGVMDISSMMEEVNASTVEVNEAMGSISEDAENMNEMVDVVYDNAYQAMQQSQKIAEIDTEMVEITKSMMEEANTNGSILTNEELIEIMKEAVVTHKNWIESLKEMADSKKLKAIQADGNRCEFGRFYNIFDLKHPIVKDAWDNVDSLHLAMHKKVEDMTQAIESNHTDQLEEQYEEAEEYSRETIALFEEIIQKIQEISKNNQSVFKEY